MSTHRKKRSGGAARAAGAARALRARRTVNRRVRPPSLNGGRRAEIVMLALITLTALMVAGAVAQLS